MWWSYVYVLNEFDELRFDGEWTGNNNTILAVQQSVCQITPENNKANYNFGNK